MNVTATEKVFAMNRPKDLPSDVLETLARWEADEARVRAGLAAPGVARPEQLAGMSGLDMFEAISRGALPSVPIGAALDFWPIEYEAGRFVFQGRPHARFLNPMGTLHGGWIATLLDSAVGCAVHTMLPADSCLLYTSPSPRDATLSRMPSSA